FSRRGVEADRCRLRRIVRSGKTPIERETNDDDRNDDGNRVPERVPHRWFVRARRGDCSGEGGCGGEGTGEHPALEGGADGAEGSEREGEPRGEDRGDHSHSHERELAAQVAEERVPGCEADGGCERGGA